MTSVEILTELDASTSDGVRFTLAKHAGQTYWLIDLLTQLSPDELVQIQAAIPRTGQEA